jgi:septum formation protein
LKPGDPDQLILASGSPRRRRLLESIGLTVEAIPSHVPEVPLDGESPRDYVRRLAASKGAEIGAQHPGRWVVSADTVVVIDNHLLEKPADRDDAARMLRAIAGRTHTVYTGLSLQRFDAPERAAYRDTSLAESKVTMVALEDEEIRWYVATGEPMDKAGAYAVQGLGAMFIEAIEGSYTNVVGLPLAELMRMLRKAGLDPLTMRRAPRAER